MERDWQTVKRLENWLRIFAPRRAVSSWGRAPFLALEETLLREYGRDENAPCRAAPSKQLDMADAEKVEAALCSPLMPAIERKLITTFYLAKDVQWSCFGRLCRSAGTSRRRAADDLMAAEWLLGNLLRRLYDA